MISHADFMWICLTGVFYPRVAFALALMVITTQGIIP